MNEIEFLGAFVKKFEVTGPISSVLIVTLAGHRDADLVLFKILRS
jgi:hypothetical protein